MDEKKLYGFDVADEGANLRTSCRPGRLPSFVVLCAALLIYALSAASYAGDGNFDPKKPRGSGEGGGTSGLFGPTVQRKGDLEPYLTKDTVIEPVLAGIQVLQVGGDKILLRVRGFKIPQPRAVTAPGESQLILQWDEVRFPQSTDKRDWWDDFEWDILRLPLKPKRNEWWKQYDFPLISRINVEEFDETSMRMIFSTSKPMVVENVEGIPGTDTLSVMLKAYEEPAPEKVERAVVYPKGDPMAIKAPVTLKLNDADVKSVFRMLAEMQKLNLLLDPSVPDMTITFSFTSIPFNEAFSYLLRAADLHYALVGSTLVVGKQESLGRTLGREVVRAYRLSYAIDDSGAVNGDLTAALTGLIPLSTTPTLDQRNRTIYVTATPEQHEEVAALLEKLDHPGRQVMIQAKIVQVNDNASQELETLVSAVYEQWLLNFSGGRLSGGYVYGSAPFEATDIGIPIPGATAGTTETLGDIALDSGLQLLSAGLSALESNGKGKVIAHPSVITIDGKQARVALTQDMMYASGVDSNGNTTFSTVSSGPTLDFTPNIGRNGVITINLNISTGDVLGFRAAGNGAQTPETTTRSVTTQVRVRNGEPFVVGGLYQETKTNDRSRIPVLGYIPLLGDLFTRRTDTHIKTEVAMIVIPYILDIPNENISTYDLIKSSLSD
ncbi:MAG: hypothetical protein LBQ56_03605 [Synergistaceae bacterium]|jgi:type IV pilus assembly protein PilQ|nr:hypothetical protein [Synergistaceae bacterium]